MAERNHQTLSNGGNMKLLIIQVIKCLIKHEPEARDLLDHGRRRWGAHGRTFGLPIFSLHYKKYLLQTCARAPAHFLRLRHCLRM